MTKCPDYHDLSLPCPACDKPHPNVNAPQDRPEADQTTLFDKDPPITITLTLYKHPDGGLTAYSPSERAQRAKEQAIKDKYNNT